jgi:hypothetical protein
MIEDFGAPSSAVRNGAHEQVVCVILQSAAFKGGLRADLLDLRFFEPDRQHLFHVPMIAAASS